MSELDRTSVERVTKVFRGIANKQLSILCVTSRPVNDETESTKQKRRTCTSILKQNRKIHEQNSQR